MRLNGCKRFFQVGLYLARRMKAILVSHIQSFWPRIQNRISLFKYFHKNLLQALYITDMPTTAAWIDHAFGYYQQVVTDWI